MLSTLRSAVCLWHTVSVASVFYNEAKAAFANGSIDWDADDIRVALLMTNTTADTEQDTIKFVTDFTTLDECDATGYARLALANEAVNIDDGNDRAELDADDSSFTSLSGDGTRDVQGALIYKHVTNDTDSPAIAFVDFSADIPSTATQIDVPWNAEGILQLT